MNAPITLKTAHNLVLKPQLPIQNYHAFYRFYLTEHHHLISRRLHVFGSSVGLYCFSKAVWQKNLNICCMAYCQAMHVHGLDTLFFEKNKPASFKQPLYSFISDWRMFSDVVRGNLSLTNHDLDKISTE